MTIEDIQAICKKLPHTTEDIKWETHLCYSIGGKVFIITNPDSSPVTASFKVNDEDFGELSEREGFKPAPYLAKHKWIYVDNISRLTKKEWTKYLGEGYKAVASKLPAKLRKQLGIK
ncbi:MAG TPA: MmcQ/YjbR family DNA-binding protein [Chitinophagaceae bacterium]|nr:MmcQ/YjbR family DNA-binding protein [Chitinophagaceae bacterium]